ncbi:MAG: hypothetical protein F9K19_22045 [Rhizobiaceae bacterium]|nr:MAG: hypothetical protein F9K19_22045 [Rhizobiaceae bacterium]CAG0981748.1 hypothetical protein RHIZO_01776 [Rhizobiaceae bacterium]
MRPKALIAGIAGLVGVVSTALAAYTDPSILTIEGEQRTVSDRYPVERLRSEFQNVEIETRTPWTKDGEVVKFRGPRIADVLRKHGLSSSKSVQFIAYDNFTSEILLEEINTYNPIFAIDRACQNMDRKLGRCSADQQFTPLSPDEQGPIFLVWPYDRLPTAYVPARNSIWVWFVVAVRPVQ